MKVSRRVDTMAGAGGPGLNARLTAMIQQYKDGDVIDLLDSDEEESPRKRSSASASAAAAAGDETDSETEEDRRAMFETRAEKKARYKAAKQKEEEDAAAAEEAAVAAEEAAFAEMFPESEGDLLTKPKRYKKAMRRGVFELGADLGNARDEIIKEDVQPRSEVFRHAADEYRTKDADELLAAEEEAAPVIEQKRKRAREEEYAALQAQGWGEDDDKNKELIKGIQAAREAETANIDSKTDQFVGSILKPAQKERWDAHASKKLSAMEQKDLMKARKVLREKLDEEDGIMRDLTVKNADKYMRTLKKLKPLRKELVKGYYGPSGIAIHDWAEPLVTQDVRNTLKKHTDFLERMHTVRTRDLKDAWEAAIVDDFHNRTPETRAKVSQTSRQYTDAQHKIEAVRKEWKRVFGYGRRA